MGRSATYLLFSFSPFLSHWVSKAHATKDGNRDSQSALAQLSVLALGVRNRLLEGGLRIGSHGGWIPMVVVDQELVAQLVCRSPRWNSGWVKDANTYLVNNE